MKNSEQPAFPKVKGEHDCQFSSDDLHGLTKREYFAAKAMQGMLANPEITNHISGFPSTREVVGYADELLKQLESK